jgi:hypothetical protein
MDAKNNYFLSQPGSILVKTGNITYILFHGPIRGKRVGTQRPAYSEDVFIWKPGLI